MTANQARDKIRDHLQKGIGIYAFGPGLGGRYFDARVREGNLEVMDGFNWWPAPLGTKFDNGQGWGSGHLFTYEED